MTLLVVLAATAGSAAASTGNAAGPITLRGGDLVTVRGSSVHCAVSAASSANPLTIVCGKGNAQSPAPGTYAIGFADTAAIVIKSSASRQPELVVREAQPVDSRAAFPPSSRGKSSALTVGVGDELLVGGTHVLCAISSEQKVPTMTCGLLAPGQGTFVLKSYVGIVSDKFAFLSRLVSGTKFKDVVAKAQPAG